jgi:putative adhesin
MSPAFRPACVGLALAALVTSACVVDVGAIDGMRYVDRQEKRFTVQGRPELKVSTFDGPIEVRPWDQPEVLVVIERRATSKEAAERIDVRFEQDGDRITVAVRRPDRSFDWHGGRSARLIVSIPAMADINARSGDGSVDVEGISGRIEVFTGDGSIRGNRLSGELRLATGDGSIRVSEASGTLTAQTGDGSVNVEGALSGVTVRTGDGTVTLVASPGSAASDDWTIATGDGSVTLAVPDAFSADLDAHTGDGRIAVENLTVSDVTGKMARNRLRGQLGTGGRLLRIRTGDGSITLRKAAGSLKAEAEAQ